MLVCKKCGGRIYEQLQMFKGTKKFICPACGATSSSLKEIAKKKMIRSKGKWAGDDYVVHSYLLDSDNLSSCWDCVRDYGWRRMI